MTNTFRPLTGEMHALWPTPVLRYRVPADPGYNDALRDVILRRQADPGGTMIGVVDGDKTRSDLLRWPQHEVIDPLRSWIIDAAEAMNMNATAGINSRGEQVDMIAEAWAVVYNAWGYHNMHAHHDSAWSGVYYVSTGKIVEGSGEIEFLDPRPAAGARTPRQSPLTAFVPEPGVMLMFPSWLQHWVTPYEGDSNRICVAFNIGFER